MLFHSLSKLGPVLGNALIEWSVFGPAAGVVILALNSVWVSAGSGHWLSHDGLHPVALSERRAGRSVPSSGPQCVSYRRDCPPALVARQPLEVAVAAMANGAAAGVW
jgi:hypothetical protein